MDPRNSPKTNIGVNFSSSLLVVPPLTPLEPQFRFWGQTSQFQAVCPQNGTAVLKVLRNSIGQKPLSHKVQPLPWGASGAERDQVRLTQKIMRLLT